MCRSGWGVSSPIKWQSKKARTLFTMARLQKKYMEKVGWPRKLFWKFRGILELQSGTILATWLRLSKISGLCGITVADIINTVETGVCPNLEKVTQTRPKKVTQNSLPDYLCEAIKPVFVTLTHDSLLQKCLHGGTQNTNESFHKVIWQRCPKTVFVSRKQLCTAVADATIVFSDWECGCFGVLGKLGMVLGKWTQQCFQCGQN